MRISRFIPTVVTGALALVACLAAPALAAAPEAPELKVEEPVHATTATFHGILNPIEAAEPNNKGGSYKFLYKAGPTCTGGSVTTPSGLSLGAVHEELPAQTVTGLTANTGYTVCLSITNLENETTLSAPVLFKTAAPAEEPKTEPATLITATAAMLHGVLNPKAEAETGWYFAYSTGAQCTSGGTGGGESAHEPPAKVKAVAVEKEISALEPNRSYKFCLVATNIAEEPTAGNELSLKTLPAVPVIASVQANPVNSTAATLTAQINPNNEPTKYTFEYSTQEKAGVLEGAIVKVPGAGELEGFPEQPASVNLTGLKPGETYFYRVLAENKQSKTEGKPVVFPVGSNQSFTSVPTPFTDAPTSLTATTVTFNGHLTPLNATVPTQFHFDYKLGAECGESGTPSGEAGTGAPTQVAETAQVTELQPNHEYTVCFVTSNASGSTEGPPVHFTTPAVAPKILSESVSGVTPAEATLEAKVNPNNQEVIYRFEYATNPALTGATSVAGAEPLSGFSSEGLTATVPALTGLKVGETYYYRIVLENVATKAVIGGATQSLTPVGAPLLSPGEVQGITATAALLPATINPAGSATAYHVAFISQVGYEEGLARDPAHPFALAKVTLEEASVPGGFEAVAVNLNLTELTPATTYEAVLVAANATGTTVSSPVAFTTALAPPAETPGPPPAGPTPLLSPFPAATLPPLVPYTTIAQLEAKELKINPGPPAKHLTKAQLLAKALRACSHKAKRQRAACRRHTKRKYR